jgi:hypothetical protein
VALGRKFRRRDLFQLDHKYEICAGRRLPKLQYLLIKSDKWTLGLPSQTQVRVWRGYLCEF